MVERNLTRNQALPQEYDFEQPVVSIGSHQDNDIILDDMKILPFHATVVLEDGQFRLIPMEPGALISIDGFPVQGTQVNLEPSQRVEIGNYALFFLNTGTPNSIRVKIFPIAGEEDSMQSIVEGSENAILLNVLSDSAEIDVEQTAFFEFEVVNAGPIVASFFVTLKGVPEKWVEISPELINLNEGQRHLVQIRVTPPRDANSKAGLHDLQLVVTSPNYGGQRSLVHLSLTIRPYYEFIVGNLTPRDQRISWFKRTGKTFLPITNQGNGSADFNIMALDDENGCSFDFNLEDGRQLNRQATTMLEAGETIEVPIEITPIKRPMFAMRSKRYHYTTSVQIPQNAAAPQTMSGSATSVPLFGWWSIVLGVAAILLAMFFILQPNIRSFTVVAGKDVIELGDTTRLDWNVSPFATSLTISNIDPPVSRGQVSVTVAPTKSTTYELVSGNWLSGLVGLDQKRSVTVLVVPPSPHVNVFEVDRTKITLGQAVNVRWSVSTADEVLLTIDEVVYPLTPEEFSGERQVVLEKDALITLEAKTASGSELQSFFVNVVPPYIDISTFTIWVRPDSAALNPGQSPVAMTTGGKRFSMDNAPDPNFPVKFVELIPDTASDNGYRVKFNPAVRTELNKGEQVMLEWNVAGVDSLQIAPFTDALPARGSQPFFPQESMNFVMTAKSGDLEGIFMLPVKVFDGIPPTAPKIEFFRGAPLQMVGAGSVELTWSISGEWTRVTLSNADGIIADNLNPVGFKTISVSQSSTIILTAYNGDLTSAMPLEFVVNPALIQIGLSITDVIPQGGSNELLVGGNATVSVGFYSDPLDPLSAVPTPDPTGKILVSDGISSCEITLPATSCALTFTTPGSPKQIKASYGGDAVYASASSDVNETISVVSAKVNLIATYFRLNKTDNSAGQPLGENITSTQFSINDGLFIQVNVIPINVVFPDDNKSWITVKFCPSPADPDGAGCTALLTVPVNVVSGQPGGVAYVPIDSFPSAGLSALFIEYQHQQYVIDTTHIIQNDLNINKMNILLSLSSCTSPDTLTGCSLGAMNPPSNATITFDLKNVLSQEKLSVLLPLPLSSAFTLSNDSGPAWSCEVVQEGVYKLRCNGIDFSTFGVKNVSFAQTVNGDPVYNLVPASGSFQLNVALQTSVSFDTTKFSSASVGQVFKLSGPADADRIINILDYSTQDPITGSTGSLSVTLTDSGMVTKTSDSSGCTVVDNQINIDNITSLCKVYFNHAGSNLPIAIDFKGDPNYAGSQTEVQVSIQKQLQVNAAWQINSNGSYIPWNISAQPPNELLKIRTVLDAEIQTPVFNADSLIGRKLSVGITINGNPNSGICKLYSGGGVLIGQTPASTGTTSFDVTISTTGSATVADFGLLCSMDDMDLVIGLGFVAADQPDFAFDPSADTDQGLFIASRGIGTLTLDIFRAADNDVTLVPNANPAIKTLYVGEPYKIRATIGVLWADYNQYNYNFPQSFAAARSNYTSRPLTAQLPANLQGKITILSSSSVCSYDSVNNKINIYLSQVITHWIVDYGAYGYSDISITNQNNPCLFTVNVGTSFAAPTTDQMQFAYTAPRQGYSTADYNITSAYKLAGADRQPVTLTFGSPVVTNGGTSTLVVAENVPTNFLVTVVPTVTGTSLIPIPTPGTSSFTASLPCVDVPPPTFSQSRQNNTQSLLTVNFPVHCASGTLQISYQATDYFKGKLGDISLTVNDPIPTTTVFSTSPSSPSLQGENITLTATVSTATGIHPAGSVEFFRATNVSLGTDTTNGSGVASLTINDLPAGANSLTAVFTPSSGVYAVSPVSNTIVYQINKPTSISVTASGTSTNYGQSVTFTATITSSAGTPTGSVQFKSNISGSFGSPVSLNGSGVAQLSYTDLPVGSHTITAVYSPTNNFAPGFGTFSSTYTVVKATTSIAPPTISPAGTIYFGDSISFGIHVSVDSGGGIPIGLVKIYEGNGSTELGSYQLTASDNGVAVITLANGLSVGTHNNIDARFLGSANYSSSTSTPKVSLTVSKATTTTSLADPNPLTANPGDPVIFSITVTVTKGVGIPVGTVEIYEGTTQIGTASLVSGDNGMKDIMISDLPTGTHSVEARFTSSPANFTDSISGSKTVTIN